MPKYEHFRWNDVQWNKNVQDVPFSKVTGDLAYYPDFHDLVWKQNEVFQDTLTYKSYGRGRSAAYFTFTRLSTGSDVNVFMTDMDEMIPVMINGAVTGTFTFCKRGQNYGCRLVKDDKNE